MEFAPDLKQSVRHFRDGKDLAKMFDVRVSGPTSSILGEIIDNANIVLANLENRNQYLIERKYRELEDYLGISYDQLTERYSEGFRKLLKQQYQLFKREQPSELNELKKDDYIEDLAVGYSFDFARTLTLGKKMGIPSTTALQLAEHSYWNNPNILIHLSHLFPEADTNLIRRAVIEYVSKPESYIQKVLESIPLLQQQFPNADLSLIKQAAMGHPSNPEAYIQKALDAIPLLKTQFPEAGLGLIKHAATNYPKNANAYIRSVLRVIPLLKSQFPDADPYLVTHSAMHHPNDPEGFIRKLLDSTAKLQKEFPNADNTLIKHAATHYRSDPGAFIQHVLDTIPIFQEQFLNADPNLIKTALIDHPSNPGAFIQYVLDTVQILQQRYPEVNISIIKRAVIGYSEPEGFIKALREGRTEESGNTTNFQM